jgi:hypothetical protein
LQSTKTISFVVNPSLKVDKIHKSNDEYFVNLSQSITDVILESAYLYQKGNDTPFDITTPGKRITLKSNEFYQTHFKFYSNISLKNCVLVERIDTVFWWNRTEYPIGNIGPEKGRMFFIIPDRKTIASIVSFVRVTYTLIDENGKEYFCVMVKYDGGKNLDFKISDEFKDVFKSDVPEDFTNMMALDSNNQE